MNKEATMVRGEELRRGNTKTRYDESGDSNSSCATDIKKVFPGAGALDVDLELKAGEIHAPKRVPTIHQDHDGSRRRDFGVALREAQARLVAVKRSTGIPGCWQTASPRSSTEVAYTGLWPWLYCRVCCYREALCAIGARVLILDEPTSHLRKPRFCSLTSCVD